MSARASRASQNDDDDDDDDDDDNGCIISCSIGAGDFDIFLKPYEKH